jgi:hypothetical protein
MKTTSHKIRAKLPYPIGPVDALDEMPIEADIAFNFRPIAHAIEMTALCVKPVEERKGEPFNREILRDLAEDWLYGDGYDEAVALAKKERGEE